jgi:prevent-host-death family protein
MLEAIPATEARQKFLPLLDRVEANTYRFSVTRHGRPVAVVLSYQDYQRMNETLKLMENRAFSQRLDQGLAEARRGELIGLAEADLA